MWIVSFLTICRSLTCRQLASMCPPHCHGATQQTPLPTLPPAGDRNGPDYEAARRRAGELGPCSLFENLLHWSGRITI